jgi:hypothetical protein
MSLSTHKSNHAAAVAQKMNDFRVAYESYADAQAAVVEASKRHHKRFALLEAETTDLALQMRVHLPTRDCPPDRSKFNLAIWWDKENIGSLNFDMIIPGSIIFIVSKESHLGAAQMGEVEWQKTLVQLQKNQQLSVIMIPEGRFMNEAPDVHFTHLCAQMALNHPGWSHVIVSADDVAFKLKKMVDAMDPTCASVVCPQTTSMSHILTWHETHAVAVKRERTLLHEMVQNVRELLGTL